MDPFQPVPREPSLAVRSMTYVLAAAALLLVIHLHLLPALLAGLLVYELVQSIAPLLGRRISGDRARMVVVASLGVIVVGLLIALIWKEFLLRQQYQMSEAVLILWGSQ